jgi:Tat protein secretion system quality control protein TatD with DNase activity
MVNFSRLTGQQDPRLCLTIVLHPKPLRDYKCDQRWIEEPVGLLKQLLELPGMVGMGEVGLNYGKPGCTTQEKQVQKRLLEAVLRGVARNLNGRPIVLHL